MTDLIMTFLAVRLAEAWAAARDRELATGLAESAETRMIDAMRKILAAYQDSGEGSIVRDALGFAVAAFAAVWDDHPDYRPEWK